MLNGTMSIMEYWKAAQFELERERKWAKKTATGHSTRVVYNRYMDKLAAAAPRVICQKPICEVTFLDLISALKAVQTHNRKTPYSESTLQNFVAVLSDVFMLAQDNYHAINVLNRYSSRTIQRLSSVPEKLRTELQIALDPAIEPAKRAALLRKAKEGRGEPRKALTMDELFRLVHILCQELNTDGRAIGIALILWLGVRPSECRGLRWEDIHAFPDRPGYYVEIRRKLDVQGKAIDQLKTRNAYRKIPIHEELWVLLKELRNTILLETGKEPSGYICCFGKNYGLPCTYVHLALYAQEKVFPHLGDDLIIDSALDMALEDLENTEHSEEYDTLTLYVLRRNFLTYMQGGSRLTPHERRYIMGHEMDRKDPNLREKYNDLNRLWKILQKMNRVIFSRELPHAHLEEQTAILEEPGDRFSALDAGVQRVHIPEGALANGGRIVISAMTAEPGDKIGLELLSPVRGRHNIGVTHQEEYIPDPCFEPGALNMEYEMMEMANRAGRRKKKKK